MKNVDGDDFSRSTRLGRAAAEAVVRASSGGAPFDGFSTARMIDHFVELLGGIASLPSILSSSRTAHVVVDGVQRPQGWLGNFAQAERDLLRVAPAVLDLDRLSLRRPLNTKDARRELHWRRGLNATIAVENPDRWNAVAEYFTAARPSLRPRPARIAKEVDRDLFAATR